MPMSNQDYWERRKAQQMYEEMKSAEDTADEISKLYYHASQYLNYQTQKLFEKYQKKYHLSENEARRLLNTLHDKSSIEELKRALKTSSADTEALLSQLESGAYAWRIEQLERLQDEIDDMMKNVYHQEKDFHTNHYVNMIKDGYYHRIFDMQKRTGLAFSFSKVDPKAVDLILKSKWSGTNYSDRIWKNTQGLAQTMKEELLINLMTGRTEYETSQIIANKFGSSVYAARRLVRTESAYVAQQIDEMSYKECEVERYRYLATLDLRTSLTCRMLDGQRFKVSEMQPGKNAPPMHPWCRSTTIADIDEETLSKLTRRARDPVTGKNYLVPANMTYQQWYEKYVAGNPQAQTNEKKEQNKARDERQQEEYQKVLGDKIPKELDKFQDLKYTDTEKWKELKEEFKVVSQYEANAGQMSADKIYELDKKAFEIKTQQFTGKAKSQANIAVMELDGQFKIANSQVNSQKDPGYVNFKGDKSSIVLLSNVQRFSTKVVGSHDRYMDSEAKLFEYAVSIVKDGEQHMLNMLSEKCMCESCLGVLEQFQKQYPNVMLNVVSNSYEESLKNKNKPWSGRSK